MTRHRALTTEKRDGLPAATSTILIVDDDEEIRDVLRMIFELDGFTVSEASNGLDAVTAIMKTNPGS